MKAIYLDMDGTIADLYGVNNWENRLNAGDVYPYLVAKPLCDMEELNTILTEIAAHGITIGVISWGAMHASAEYTREVKKVKKKWIEAYLTCVTEIHVVKYGTPKHKVAKVKESVLVDDNETVRDCWKNGTTIDATDAEIMLEELREILETLRGE